MLLFADPREAESSCGCGQIIRMVRAADVPGIVAVQEFDPRRETEAARVHAVRVNPTVIIARGDGAEQVRFEDESPDVIAGLRGALAALTSGPAQDTKSAHRAVHLQIDSRWPTPLPESQKSAHTRNC